MRITIGVMGSAGGLLDEEASSKLETLGRAIAEHDCILITGGCQAYPIQPYREPKRLGGWWLASLLACPLMSMCRSTAPQRKALTS
jgi:hypothetical protein